MIQVSRSQTGDSTLLTVSGVVDESVDVANALNTQGPISGNVILNLKGISKINSVGVRNWIMAMQELSKSASFRYQECSPAVVECLNLIMNFGAGAPIESILLPYRCESCNRESLIRAKTEDLTTSSDDPKPVSCPHCKSGTAVFDDFPDDYFQFLKV